MIQQATFRVINDCSNKPFLIPGFVAHSVKSDLLIIIFVLHVM